MISTWKQALYSELKPGDRFTIQGLELWDFFKNETGYYSGKSGVDRPNDMKPDTIVFVPAY